MGKCSNDQIRSKVSQLINNADKKLSKREIAIHVAKTIRMDFSLDSSEFTQQDREDVFKLLRSMFILGKLHTDLSIEEIDKVSRQDYQQEKVDKEPRQNDPKQLVKIEKELNYWFGDSYVKLQMQQDFTSEILKSFFVDIENQIESTDNIQGTIQLLRYKSSLFKDLIDYYNSVNPEDKIVLNSELYNSDGSFNLFDKATFDKINNLFSIPYSGTSLDLYTEKHPELVDIYKKWFIYKNFDYLLLHEFNGIIDIANSLVGVDVYNNYKYQLVDTTDVNAQSWGDKEKTPDQIMNLILQKLLTTFKKYDSKTGQVKQGVYLTKTDLNNAMSTIKNIVFSNPARTITLESILTDELINKYGYELVDLGLKIKENSLYDLGNLMRTNGEIVYPILFEILSNPSAQRLISQKAQIKFMPWDSIYSLNKSLFEAEGKSLFNLATKNRGGRANKYYDMFVAQMDLTSPNNVTSIKFEKGKPREQFMFLSQVKSETRILQRAINAALTGNLFNIGVNIEKLNNGKYRIYKEGVFSATYDPKARHTEAVQIKFENNDTDYVYSELTDFYSNILQGISFKNTRFKDSLFLEFQGSGVNAQLLKMCIPMLAKHIDIQNYEFKNDLDLRNHLSRTYNVEEMPKVTFPYTLYIDFFNDKDLGTFDKLVELDYIVKNKLLKNTILTADGNMISSQSITNGSTEVTERWAVSNANPNSVTSGYSVFDRFLGYEKLRELSSSEVYKKATRMTFNENLTTRFVEHFLKMRSKNETKVIYSTTSDKEDIGVKKFRFNFTPLKQNKFEATDKSELVEELRDSYQKTLDLVRSDYYKLNEWLQQQKISNSDSISYFVNRYGINPINLYIGEYGENTFDGLNSVGQKAYSLFLDIISRYNEDNFLNEIDFVNNVHYSADKKGKLYANLLISELRNRFDGKYAEHIAERNRRFLFNLLTNNFELQVKTINGDYIDDSYKILAKDINDNNWIDSNGKLILFKYKTKDQIVEQKDPKTGKITTNIVPGKWHNGESTYNLESAEEILINPVLAEFNELHYLLSQQYNNATLGSYIYCAAKNAIIGDMSKEHIEILESTKMIDYIKRNVDQSATVNQHLLNSIYGISQNLNIAYYLDVEAPAETVSSFDNKVKVHDGGIFEEAVTHLLIQNMSNRPENTTDKPLFTGFLEKSGSGWIVKCASYAFTNENMRGATFRQLMQKKMMSKPFGVIDVTKDLYGNDINYGKTYLMQNGRYYLMEFRNSGDNTYDVLYTEVNKNGSIKVNKDGKRSQIPIRNVKINNNWDLYQLFGGVNSCSLNNQGLLELSEESLRKMVTAVNNVARPRNLNIEDLKKVRYLTQLHVQQPLKDALVSYAVPEGACKKGFTNPNPMDAYTHEGFLNVTKQRAIQFGRQLDPTHEVDQSEVSLMTQVMMGLSSSNSYIETEKVYSALAELSNLTNKEFIDVLMSNNKEDFDNLISNLLLTSIIKDRKETSLKKLLQPLIDKYEKDKTPITYQELSQYLSFDDPSVYNYLISLISSKLSSETIRQKFTGTLSVLNPSWGIQKTYTAKIDGQEMSGRKLSDFTDPSYFIINPREVSFIQFERTYKAIKDDVETEYITVRDSNDYNRLRTLQSQGYRIIEHFYQELPETDTTYTDIYKLEKADGSISYIFNRTALAEQLLRHYRANNAKISKIKLFGSDLKSYNILFRDSGENGIATQYQIWDMKVVQYAAKQRTNKNLRRIMQNMLSQLADNKLDYVYVRDFNEYNNPFKLVEGTNLQYNPETNLYELNFTNNNIRQVVEIEKRGDSQYLSDPIYDKNLVIALGLELLKKQSNLISANVGQMDQNEIKIWRQLFEEGWASISTEGDNEQYHYIFDSSEHYKKIKLDKSSIQIQNYQAILPSVHASQLGLPKGVSVPEILNDKNWFLTRNLKNIISDIGGKHYSYALKRFNGKHIYITSDDLQNQPDYTFLPIDYEVETINGNKHVYQIDDANNRIQELSSEQDLIYQYGDSQIIVTKNPEWYIANEKYNILISGDRTKIISSELLEDKLVDRDQFELEVGILQDQLQLNGKIPDLDIKELNKVLYKLKKQSDEQYNSFKKSLETLVARIPAQGMSSFMTMDIADFVDGKNNAYVNHMQIFLQGSDYDVDKATFLEYTLDKSGKFIGWSPFFDLSSEQTMNASLNLPLPVLSNVFTIKEGTATRGFESSILDVLDKYTSLKYNIRNLNKGKIRYDIESNPDNLKLLSELLSEEFVSMSYDVTKLDSKYLKDGKLKKKYSDLIEIYNRHHRYLSKVNSDTAEDALKNFVVHWSCYISKSPKNLLRSTTPIDDASEALKSVASKTLIANFFRNHKNLPGDESAKSNELTNVMTGKDGVGVAASIGVKTYNALLYYYSRKVKKLQSTEDWKNPKNWEDIIKPIEFLGKTYGLLSSIDLDLNKVPEELKEIVYRSQNATQLSGLDINKLPENLKQIVLEARNNVDTRDTVSAWVSLAVDNAKELKLGELNANPDFMGMYLYAAYVGIPQEEVSKILTSQTAKILLSYMTDDIYLNRVGLMDPMAALQKIKEIPNFKDFEVRIRDNERRESIDARQKDMMDENGEFRSINSALYYLQQQLRKAPKERKFANELTVGYDNRLHTYYIAKKEIHEVQDKDGTTKKQEVHVKPGSFKSLSQIKEFESLLSELLNYLNESKQIDYSVKNALYRYRDIIKKKRKELEIIYNDTISLGTEERHRDISVDGDVKTITEIVDIKSPLYKAINTLFIGQQELSTLRGWLGLNQGLKTNTRDILNFLYNLQRAGSTQDENGKKQEINVESYLSSKRYRSDVAQRYEKTKKVSFNIFNVINSLKHYQSYFDALYIQHKALSLSSTYKLLYEKGFNDLKKFVGKVEDDTVNAFQASLLRDRINDYLINDNYEMEVPIMYSLDSNVLEFSKKIKLGSDVDNFLFVKFMNEILIPDLRFNRGIGTQINYSNNEFVKSLLPTMLSITPNKTFQQAYRLDIEAIPKNDAEIVQLAKVSDGFRKLKDKTYTINGQKYNLGDLFWYYNLILYNNRTLKNSLTPVFNRLINDLPRIREYHAFLGRTQSTDYTENSVMTFAPTATRQQAEAKGLKAYWEIDMYNHAHNLYALIPPKELQMRSEQAQEIGLDVDKYELKNSRGNLSDEWGFTLNFSTPGYMSKLKKVQKVERVTQKGRTKFIFTIGKGAEIEVNAKARYDSKSGKYVPVIDLDVLYALIDGSQKPC